MRALRAHAFGEPRDVVGIDEVAPPTPGPGQVRVRVGAAALNLPDVLVCRGGYVLNPEHPFTLGLEAAGTVVNVGPGVDEVLLGRRVASAAELPNGALAEECIFVANRAFPVPDDMSDVDAAAMFIALHSAHCGLHLRASLRAGETLLVHAAAGGVGSAAVQLGALAGARVIATAGSLEKLALCRALGADVAINYREDDFAEIVKGETAGRGADVIFDPVGGEVFERSQRCIAGEGRIVLVGFAGGTVQTIKASHVLMRNYSVVGMFLGGYYHSSEGRAYLQRTHTELLELIRAERLRPVIDRVITLEDVADALTDLGARETAGRIIVEL